MDEPLEREAGGSTKEADEKLEEDSTKQVTEGHFDEKGAGKINEAEESGTKKTPRAGKLRSWWKKIWPASSDLQSTVQQEEENYPRTEPDRDPDEADKKQDTMCVGKLDRASKTKEQFGFHNTKYGSMSKVREKRSTSKSFLLMKCER